MSHTSQFGKSFYDHCNDLCRTDLLDRWDYELNERDPRAIGYKSKFKVYLKCPRGIHASTAFPIASSFQKLKSGVSKRECPMCKSLAQWGIDKFGKDFLATFWDYKKNTISPWEIGSASMKKIWIKCDKTNYHGSYLRMPNDLKYGHYCPMCAHQDNIHPYDSLAISNPEVFPIWSDKNTKTPYMYSPSSAQVVWWKCENGKHEDYERKIHDSTYQVEFRCPRCVEESRTSLLQQKVNTVLETTKYTILHESECTIAPISPKSGRKLLYDNEIEQLRAIIEVHGQQHYSRKEWFTKYLPQEEQEKSFEEAKWRDQYKKDYAISRGYRYLEIPYHAISSSKKYITMIRDFISSLEQEVSA